MLVRADLRAALEKHIDAFGCRVALEFERFKAAVWRLRKLDCLRIALGFGAVQVGMLLAYFGVDGVQSRHVRRPIAGRQKRQRQQWQNGFGGSHGWILDLTDGGSQGE